MTRVSSFLTFDFCLLPFALVERLLLQCSLRRSEPGDRNTEWRAAHVVEADLVEEMNRRRIAAVLAAHADLEIGLGRASFFRPDLDQLPDAFGVERRERVAREYSTILIRPQELADVVA